MQRLVVFFLSGVCCLPALTTAGDDQPLWHGTGSTAASPRSDPQHLWSGDRWESPQPRMPAHQPQARFAEPASPAKTRAPDSAPQSRQREFEIRQLQQRQRELAKASLPRLTAWQLQNPSGSRNCSPTEFSPGGLLAPNTYYGPAHREWNQLTGPVTLTQMPFNYRAEPTVLHANVPLAPPTYLGRAQAEWSQGRTFSATPHAFGGWNVGP